MDSYKRRDEILNQINAKVRYETNIKSLLFMNNINLLLLFRFDVLLVTGVKFRGLKDSEQIQQQVFD